MQIRVFFFGGPKLISIIKFKWVTPYDPHNPNCSQNRFGSNIACELHFVQLLKKKQFSFEP